jgi:hypothetical protein
MCDNLIEAYYTVLFAICDATTQFLKKKFVYENYSRREFIKNIFFTKDILSRGTCG